MTVRHRFYDYVCHQKNKNLKCLMFMYVYVYVEFVNVRHLSRVDILS